MEAPVRTRFDDRGLVVVSGAASGAGERRVPFYAGAMHYWRVDPKRWAACLKSVHGLGLTCVETYVPWRVHEVQAGTYDWSGARDLARFISLAAAEGLAVVLRPGPHVNAELTAFGFPDHVLADVNVQARTAHGTPAWLPSPPRAWPIPSYASAALHVKVRAWYAEVARVVAPHLESVVAIGVDNEAQMFFRLGPYDLDYHPDAIAWWREASGQDGAPPRAWDDKDAARCISWVRFKEQYLARALGMFAHALGEGFPGIARFHNLPPGPLALSDLRGVSHAIGGPVGIDAYTPRAQLRTLRRRAIQVAAVAQPLPLAPEVGIGFFPWFPPLDAGDDPTRERDHLLTLLAGGIRGFNLFMAVERDRYYGAAIDKHGNTEKHAAWIAPLVSALAEIDWPALRRATPIALVETRADARFGRATNLADPMTPVLSGLLGIDLGTDAASASSTRWHDAVCAALELAQVPFAIVDESVTEAELATYRAVIVPTLRRIDRGLAHNLRALVEHKRAVVVIGPAAPTHDELDQPFPDALPKRVGRMREGSLDDIAGLAQDLSSLAGDLSDAWQVERPDSVRAFAHADAAGKARAVFVINDGAKPATVVLLADERPSLRDPLTNEVFRVIDGKVSVPVATIRLLV